MTIYGKRAFTVVELLIVIVVIGILAGIVLVAFRGYQSKAHTAVIQTDLKNNASLLDLDKLKNRSYPASVAAANFGDGLVASQDNSLHYYVSPDGKNYCLQESGNGIDFYITDTHTTPTKGTCSGDLIAWVGPSEPTPDPEPEPEPDPEPEPEDPPATPSCGAYETGDTGPGGGIIYFAARSPQSWGCYMEVARSNWYGTSDPTVQWGCRGTNVPYNSDYGGSKQNTNSILDACSTPGIAARIASDYRGGGQSDWYLPNSADLSALKVCVTDELFVLLGDLSDPNNIYQHTCSAATASAINISQVGNNYYWTSNQFYPTNTTNALALDMTTHSSSESTSKADTTVKVRPVRIF